MDSYCCLDGTGCDCKLGIKTISFLGTPTALTTIGVTSIASVPLARSVVQSISRSIGFLVPSSTARTSETSAQPLDSATDLQPSQASSGTSALKVVLGVGITLGLISLILVSYLIWRKTHRPTPNNGLATSPPCKNHLYQDNNGGEPRRSARQVELHELALDNDPRELPTHTSPRQ